jgi:outer membrane protein with beta-barrel domain
LSKFTIRMLPLLAVLLLASAGQANAQSFGAYFGLGSAFDSSATNAGCASGQVYDPFNASPGPPCVTANGMGGVFGVFGADFMIKPHLGINGEYSFRFAQAQYATSLAVNNGFADTPITVRPAFYDFNAIYQPTSGDKQIVPVIEGGVGGAHLSYYVSQSAGNLSTSSSLFVTTNHFQVHGAVGVKIYVKSDIFIKPQFDIHYVPHLTDQYGRNFVPAFTISIGYTFGRT